MSIYFLNLSADSPSPFVEAFALLLLHDRDETLINELWEMLKTMDLPADVDLEKLKREIRVYSNALSDNVRVCFYIYVCLFLSVSIYMSVCLSVCLSVCVSVNATVRHSHIHTRTCTYIPFIECTKTEDDAPRSVPTRPSYSRPSYRF
jgi:hypothetical protein